MRRAATRHDSMQFTPLQKAFMVACGIAIATGMCFTGYVLAEQYFDHAEASDRAEACAKDRDRMNRPPSDEHYTIPQGCYTP